MSDPLQSRGVVAKPFPISAIFLLLVGVFIMAAVMLGVGRGGAIGVFVLVLVGWIISLCLHEWGHAAVAWAGGDRSVAELGYLTLNPLRYLNPVMSILLPLAFLAMGGIGFPGGAVYVNHNNIRGAGWRSAVSAAGPGMTFLCLLAIALALAVAPMNDALYSGLAFLAMLEATALVLNLLPIPGLDGFGILEPFLPAKERDALAPIARFVGFAFLICIFMIPQVFAPIWRAGAAVCGFVGINPNAIDDGIGLFRFWETQ